MKLVDGRLTLSPTDLSNFLACEHLTALELRSTRRRARGRRRPAGRADQAQGRRARGGLPREAPRRRARRPRRSSSNADAGLGRRRAATEPRCATASTSSTRRVFADGRWRGLADFLDARRASTAQLRGARHQARAAREAALHPPALLLQRAARADPGREPRADPRPARLRRAACRSGPRSSPPTTGACARGSSGSSPTRRPTEPWPDRPLRRLRLQAALRRALGRGRPPLARRGHPPRADREAARRRDRDARRARPRAATSRRPGISPRDLREAPRAGRAPALGRASTAATATCCSPPQPGAGFALLPEPVARRPLLRLRGQPVLGRGRRPRVPLGDPRRRPQLHAAARARPRERARARSSSSSTSSTRACASTPTCTSTTTRRTRSPRSSG